MARIARRAYAEMFGPTVGDRIRLADTNLVAEVEAVKGSALKDLSDQLRQSKKADAVLLGSVDDGRVVFAIHVGDTICIPPGTPHRVDNTGPTELKILCCCSPPYSHADTELLK